MLGQVFFFNENQLLKFYQISNKSKNLKNELNQTVDETSGHANNGYYK